MNSQISPNKIEPGKHNLRIKVLLEKLRNKLKNFAVLGKGGYYIGEVKDVKLDRERQLNLVIAQTDSENETRWVLLRSKHIQQVDSGTKILFVDITKAEVAQLPDYALPTTSIESGIINSSSPQTTVPVVIDQNVAPVNDTSSSNLLDVNAGVVPEIRFHAPDTYNLTAPEYHQEEYDMDIEESLLSHETEVVEEEVIRLLEERLVVDTSKRKVGEVIVRKVIETRMVQVPVRYEKLIVEQVNPEHKHLAEIILNGEDLNDISELTSGNGNGSLTTNQTNEGTVSGEFKSPKSASLFLNAIALQRHHGCAKVRVELVLEDPQLKQTYEQWFERCTGS